MTINKKCFNKSLSRDWSNIKNPVTVVFAIIAFVYMFIVFYDSIVNLLRQIPLSGSIVTISFGLIIVFLFLMDLDKDHVKKETCGDDIGALSVIFLGTEFVALIFFGVYNSAMGYPMDAIAYFTELALGSVASFILIVVSTPIVRAYKLCNNEPDEEEQKSKEEPKKDIIGAA